MRKVIFLFLLCISITAAAQNNEGKRPVYCNLMAYNLWGFGIVKVQLDMGDYTRAKGYDAIYDESGKKMKFKTIIEAINYMAERGWRVVGNYEIEHGQDLVLHIMMEKMVREESEKKEGLILKESREKPYREKTDDTYYKPKKEEE